VLNEDASRPYLMSTQSGAVLTVERSDRCARFEELQQAMDRRRDHDEQERSGTDERPTVKCG
jgi:hypothetical protein